MTPTGRRQVLWAGPRGVTGPPDTIGSPHHVLDPDGVADLPVGGLTGGVLPLGEHLTLTDTDAFVVVHDGRLAASWYRSPEVAQRPQALMSITKSFIGILAGILMTAGRLDPRRPASAYVPELATGTYAHVTVRDLLDMRTGSRLYRPFRETHFVVDDESVALARAVDGTGPTLRELVAGASEPITHAGPFSYRSLTSEALGWVLERAGDRPLAEQLSDLCELLDLAGPVEISVDAAGVPHASGGLGMTALDVARFGFMLLRGGAVGDRRVVPPAYIRDIRHGGVDSASAFAECLAQLVDELPATPRFAWGHYRNQFWVPSADGRIVLCLGIHGQLTRVDADTDTVVVKLSSWPEPRDPVKFTDGLECAAAAAAHTARSSISPVS